MAWFAAIAAGASTAIKAWQQNKVKQREGDAYVDAKNRSMAATTREMAEEERKKEYMHSRALAVAAFSGAGTSDPGMVKILADLNAEGEYRVMSKLWAGQNEAAGLSFRAEAARREGEAIWDNVVISSLSSGASAYGGFS